MQPTSKPIRLALAFPILLILCGCGEVGQVSVLEAPLPILDLSAPDAKPSARWPAWRGEQHGVADCETPLTWSATSGLRWRSVLPGEGNSSPIVWGDRIFVTCAESNVLSVVCFDRQDGRQLWQTAVGECQWGSHSKNGFASSTPCTDGVFVYGWFGELGLCCFDFDGNLRWRTQLVDEVHKWGISSSPVLFDDYVIQLCDGPTESHLIAIRRLDGEVAWRVQRDSSGSWDKPLFGACGGWPSADCKWYWPRRWR